MDESEPTIGSSDIVEEEEVEEEEVVEKEEVEDSSTEVVVDVEALLLEEESKKVDPPVEAVEVGAASSSQDTTVSKFSSIHTILTSMRSIPWKKKSVSVEAVRHKRNILVFFISYLFLLVQS